MGEKNEADLPIFLVKYNRKEDVVVAVAQAKAAYTPYNLTVLRHMETVNYVDLLQSVCARWLSS